MIRRNANGSVIQIGKQGENLALEIAFPDSTVWGTYYGGDGKYVLLHQRPGEEAVYQCNLYMDNGIPVWRITSADTAIASSHEKTGRAELRYLIGDTIVKSCVYRTLIAPSLTGTDSEPPDPAGKAWYEKIESEIGDLSKLETEEKDSLVGAINEAAKSGLPEITEGTKEMALYNDGEMAEWRSIPAVGASNNASGDSGLVPMPGMEDKDKFLRGDGTWADVPSAHTPVITAEKSGKVTTIKADGVTIATVNDGTDGTNGTDGAPGAKGDPGDDYVLTDADKTEIAAEVIAGGVEAELGEEPLPAPASAAIGQIVKVKSVDENGKITQTEAVDMPSGSDASLSMTGAQVGQIAKITAVDTDGKPTKWEPVDDRLPSVNTNDDGKVLIVRQISEFKAAYVLEHMPNINDFIHLGITDASPGQFAKVLAVNEFGQPISWEVVDMPSGGGGETWELLADQAALEEDAVSVGFDVPDCKKYMVLLSLVNTSASAGNRAGQVNINNSNAIKAITGSNSFIAQTGTRSARFIFEKLYGRMYWTCYNSNNGDGIVDGTTENMSSFNSGAFPAPDTVTRLSVSSLNESVTHFIGAGSRIKIYGVRT